MNRSLKGICFTVAGGCCWGMSGVMGNIYLMQRSDGYVACDSQIIRGRNLPAVAYVSEKREFNFSCMEKKRFSGQSADLRDDWNGYVSDDVLPCHSGVKSGNCDSYSVFCTNLNYGVLCISGKRFPKKEEVLVLATVIVGIFLLATHGSIKT